MSSGLVFVIGLAAIRGVPYGGSIATDGRMATAIVEPAATRSIDQLSMLLAVYEGLFRLDETGTPVGDLAASVVALSDQEIRIEIQPQVTLHDGRLLRASDVLDALERQIGVDPIVSAWLLPVEGVVAFLLNNAERVGIVVAPEDENTLVFRLARPYPDFLRLLSLPRARIRFLSPEPGSPPTLAVGSGPFSLVRDTDGTLRLDAFLFHRRGRPFIDRVLFSEHPKRWRPDARIAFFPREKTSRRSPDPVSEPCRELVYLVVNESNFGTADTMLWRAVDGVIDRSRIVQRVGARDATPTTTILFAEADAKTTRSEFHPLRQARPASLLVSRSLVLPRAVLERLQLDLLRINIRARIESLDEREFRRRRAKGDFDLAVDRWMLDAPDGASTTDRFHSLLFFAASEGRLLDIGDPEILRLFSVEPEPKRRELLSMLDLKTRLAARIVPILRRVPVAVVDEAVRNAVRQAARLDLENAHLAPEAIE